MTSPFPQRAPRRQGVPEGESIDEFRPEESELTEDSGATPVREPTDELELEELELTHESGSTAVREPTDELELEELELTGHTGAKPTRSPSDELALEEPTAGDLQAELSGPRLVGQSGLPRGEPGEVPDWMGRGAWVVSGAMAAAVVLALVIWEPARYAESRQGNAGQKKAGEGAGLGLSPTIVHLAEARVLSSGKVQREGAVLSVDTPLREADELEMAAGACLSIEPELRVCAPVATRVVVRSLARAQRVLEVQRGLLVARLPVESHAELVLRHESLRGSSDQGLLAFAAGPSELEVWAGAGDVEIARHAERLTLESGQGVRWNEASGLVRFELGADQVARFSQLDATAEGPAASGSAPRRVARGRRPRPSAKPVPVALDPEASGATPPPVAPTTEPGLEAQAPEASDTETVVSEQAEGAPLSPSEVEGATSSPSEVESATSSPSEVEGAEPSTEEPERALPPVLAEADRAYAQAERLRKARRFAAAEAAFEALLAEHPDAPAAQRAAAALGDLRLRWDDDPLGALGAYRAYLGELPPGPLDIRTRLGIIQALEQLNRFAHERKAIEDFLMRYPGNPEVPRLEARRTFLGGG